MRWQEVQEVGWKEIMLDQRFDILEGILIFLDVPYFMVICSAWSSGMLSTLRYLIFCSPWYLLTQL